MKKSIKKYLIPLPLLTHNIRCCRNLGNGGHNSISHPHAQFPKNYNLEDVLVSHYCYTNYNQSCPTCHTHGLLEYSCSFCIENTCEQESCGKWGWLNQLEECRQQIITKQTQEMNVNLDQLQHQFDLLISGNKPKIQDLQDLQDLDSFQIRTQINQQIIENTQQKQFIHSSQQQQIQPQQQSIQSSNTSNDINQSNNTTNKQITVSSSNSNPNLQQLNFDYRIYCADPSAELNKATLRCYAQCPNNYNRFGVSCFSNCATPQKDEFSTYCIEPEVRKPIELFSSCAEDCNENNIHDFCFACPEGMHKKDCQCVKSEKIEFREILERSYSNAIMLLID